MPSSTTTWIAVGTAAIAAYAFYVDNKRKSDPQYRRALLNNRQEAFKIINSRKPAVSTSSQNQFVIDNDDPVPLTPEGVQGIFKVITKKAYFLKYLQMGETLLQSGPSSYEKVAVCYFRALKVYPDPMNLIMALEQSLPQTVMEMIMKMMAKEADGGQKISEVDIELE